MSSAHTDRFAARASGSPTLWVGCGSLAHAGLLWSPHGFAVAGPSGPGAGSYFLNNASKADLASVGLDVPSSILVRVDLRFRTALGSNKSH